MDRGVWWPVAYSPWGHKALDTTEWLTQRNCKITAKRQRDFLGSKISSLLWMSVNICEVQFSAVAQLCLTLCDPMDCSTPGFPVHHQLLEFTHAHVHWVGDAIQPSHPLLLSPSVFPSVRVLSNESALCIRWPKYWSPSFSISSSKEHPGLISFRIDWLDLLAVQRTLTFKYSQFSYSPIMNTQLTSIHNVHVWWPTTYIIHMVWCI